MLVYYYQYNHQGIHPLILRQSISIVLLVGLVWLDTNDENPILY